MRQSCKLCYGLGMKCYQWNIRRFLGVALLALSVIPGPVLAQTAPAKTVAPPAASATAPKAQAGQPKSEKLESIQEHFEGVQDTRGFPMNLLPLNTQANLVWAALGVAGVSALLIVGGGSIAIVNYESQSQPSVLPKDRLDARAAGRVGLGIAAAGIGGLFLPPLLIDLALPQPKVEDSVTPDPKIIKAVTPAQPTETKKKSETNTTAGASPSTAPPAKVKKK